jgi:hypothetical protein
MKFSTNKQLIGFQTSFGVLSWLYWEKCWKMFPHFKYLHGQQNNIPKHYFLTTYIKVYTRI